MKTEITRRFINSLDYLLDTRRLKSIVEFEEITGFRQQRISGMRKFLSEGDAVKSYFANTDHVFMVNQKFGISLRYLILGEKPILEEVPKEVQTVAEPREDYSSRFIQEIREEIDLLKDKHELLKERFEFYLQKNKG